MKNKSNLLKLLILFKNRPHHLHKYLIENNALTDDFLKRTNMSSKIRNLQLPIELNFPNIDKMQDFFDSLNVIDDKNETTQEKEIKWNTKLSEAINNEDYEAASRIRDYMKKHNLKKL